jgi:hypothetical protein
VVARFFVGVKLNATAVRRLVSWIVERIFQVSKGRVLPSWTASDSEHHSVSFGTLQPTTLWELGKACEAQVEGILQDLYQKLFPGKSTSRFCASQKHLLKEELLKVLHDFFLRNTPMKSPLMRGAALHPPISQLPLSKLLQVVSTTAKEMLPALQMWSEYTNACIQGQVSPEVLQAASVPCLQLLLRKTKEQHLFVQSLQPIKSPAIPVGEMLLLDKARIAELARIQLQALSLPSGPATQPLSLNGIFAFP